MAKRRSKSVGLCCQPRIQPARGWPDRDTSPFCRERKFPQRHCTRLIKTCAESDTRLHPTRRDSLRNAAAKRSAADKCRRTTSLFYDAFLISILRSAFMASGFLAAMILRTPLSNFASTLASSIVSGRRKERSNDP